MLSMAMRKKQFERHMIQSGKLDAFTDSAESEIVRMDAELRDALKSTVPCPKTDNGRRMNNFCMGSDPEFVLVAPGQRRKTRAFDIGLRPGLAAGCDQNLRLAELRGWPTHSVVEHVAGIMASLRWLYRSVPDTGQYYWRAGAHFDGDGLGGHVHFGRKRPNRDREVAALDGMATVFRNGNFFDNVGWQKRNDGEGDNLHQRYGLLGDIRPQLHGYEYRTLPSWLCSPLKAFVVITASKLAVLDPEMTTPWKNREVGDLATGLDVLQRFARYYAGRDDDAWTLKHLLVQPEFIRQAGHWSTPVPDFKHNWGIVPGLTPPTKQPTRILPAVIRPDITEVAEMAEHLGGLVPLVYREVAPTFRNSLPNKHYMWLYETVGQGIQYGGAGDLLHNLVGHDGLGVQIRFGNGMFVSTDLYVGWAAEEKAKFKTAFPQSSIQPDVRRAIQFDRHSMGVGGITLLRKFLLNWGLLPIWTVDAVKDTSYEEFRQHRIEIINLKTKNPPLRERVL